MNARVEAYSTGTLIGDKLLELLGAGLSASVAASAVGVTPGYVSQLLEQEDFRLEVQIRRAGKAEAALEVDGSWDSVEKQAIDKMKQMMPLVNKVSDLIKIAQIANAAKRSARELEGTDAAGSPTVSFIIPAAAQVHFQINSESQVIQIDGRSTEALPIQQLQKRLAERKVAREVLDVSAKAINTNSNPGERRKVASVLEAIGFSEEAEEVQNILTGTNG